MIDDGKRTIVIFRRLPPNDKMLDSIKNFVLWTHQRGTWQYDVFCLLIIAFIFLTPKAWFEKREKLATQTARLVVKADNVSLEKTGTK